MKRSAEQILQRRQCQYLMLMCITGVRATQQIVGRERRERVSQLDSSGEALLNSRRRVNSTVMLLS